MLSDYCDQKIISKNCLAIVNFRDNINSNILLLFNVIKFNIRSSVDGEKIMDQFKKDLSSPASWKNYLFDGVNLLLVFTVFNY